MTGAAGPHHRAGRRRPACTFSIVTCATMSPAISASSGPRARGEDVRRMTLSASGSGHPAACSSATSAKCRSGSRPTGWCWAGTTIAKPVLQGWAIVDNTIGQDWTNVELSLVAGAPQSFVQQIWPPYYARRPVVPLPPAVQLQAADAWRDARPVCQVAGSALPSRVRTPPPAFTAS